MKIKPWIILKYDVSPNVFLCDRCGQTRQVHLPAAIKDFTKQGEAFSESHRFCKEVKKK